jgi:glutamate racemase
MTKTAPIGVFDSGMGGISVLGELLRYMPTENYIYYGDSANAPYGVRETKEVIDLSVKVSDYLIEQGVKAIVVACNTATSAAIKVLRSRYDIPIIGMEPALKPAVENTKSGQVAVMATEVTLREKKFEHLVQRLDVFGSIKKVPCPSLVPLVEKGQINGPQIDEALKACFSGIEIEEVKGVVLGCTHFVFLKEAVRKLFGENVQIFDGNFGTVKHLRNKLDALNQLNSDNESSRIQIINSNSEEMLQQSHTLLNLYRILV